MTTDYSTMMDPAMAEAMSGFWAIYYIVIIALTIVSYIGMWKMFTKAGKPGWASLIPIYNYYCMFDIAWGNGWLCLLLLVPCVNYVILIILSFKTASAYGKGIGFGFGLLFLSPIFYMILGFGDAEYIGPQ